MTTIELLRAGVSGLIPVKDGADIVDGILGTTNKFIASAKALFERFLINPIGTTRIGSRGVLMRATTDNLNDLHPLSKKNLSTTCELITGVFYETLDRYEHAYKTNKPSLRKSIDASVLALNKAGWDLLGDGGFILIFENEACATKLQLRDPQMLRVVRPDDENEAAISNCLVKGVRVVSQFTQDLFPNIDIEVDAVITIDGDIPEIENRMTVRDLQSVFVGYRYLSARVCWRKGEIPRVQGFISLTPPIEIK